MGYLDGAVSKWPPEAWQAFNQRPTLVITVLADVRAPVFDYESGNASADKVAAAVEHRLGQRTWSTIYTNQADFADMDRALHTKSVYWMDASRWPLPGVYLHAADPDRNIAAGKWRPPVTPVAIQDRWMGGYDISSCYGSYPVVPAGPPVTPRPVPPAPPVRSVIVVNLHQLIQGATGDDVRALQILLNGRGNYRLADDGIYGPNTHAAVVDFQRRRQLGADGIAGTHTWGALLGVPQ